MDNPAPLTTTDKQHTVAVAGLSLVLLCQLANLLSHADRQMLIILVEVVKADLALSDTEFGLLQGLAFSVCYSLFTVLLAKYADHYSRTRVIACGIFIWSGATLACGFADSYGELFAARMGIGLGQALLSPAVYSLLASTYAKSSLGKMTAIYATGGFIGNAIILVCGGWLADLSLREPSMSLPILGTFSTWRLAFIIAGIIGMVYAVIFDTIARETRRTPCRAEEKVIVPFRDVLVFLRQHKHTMGVYIVGFSLSSMAMFSLIVWGPAYFIRVHQMEQAQVGLMLAAMYISANLSGVYASGWLVDRLHNRGIASAPMLVGAGAALATALCLLPFVLAESLFAAASSFFLAAHFSSYPIAPSATANQLLAPERMRARTYATFLCINNLSAMSIGVAVVGLLNDYLFQTPLAVGYSLAITAGGSGLLACLVLYCGRGFYSRTLADQSRET